MIDRKNKALIQLHFSVILFGFTAILGDLIQMSALMIVWWRVLITSFSLLFFIKFGKELLKLSRHQILVFLGVGVIIALHWLSFYGAVKLSNASITLICMATTSLFTSFVEPIFFKKQISKLEIMLGAAIIPCMALVVNGVDSAFHLGVAVGLTSAFLAALFSVINKKYVSDVNVISMTFVEMVGVLMFLTLIIPLILQGNNDLLLLPPSSLDWFYIIILALLCTTLAWVISMYALRALTVFEANLVVNLEPVYGILLAAFILKEYEQLNLTFYIGAGLIICIVLGYPLLKKRINKRIVLDKDGL